MTLVFPLGSFILAYRKPNSNVLQQYISPGISELANVVAHRYHQRFLSYCGSAMHRHKPGHGVRGPSILVSKRKESILSLTSYWPDQGLTLKPQKWPGSPSPESWRGRKNTWIKIRVLLAKKTGEQDMEEATSKCMAFWLEVFIGAFIL